METIGFVIGFLVIVAFCCWGCVYEVKRIKAATVMYKKRELLYDAWFKRLEDC